MLSTKRMSKILGIVLLLAFMPLWVMAQTAVVKGSVSDADGPLMGATVKVKGTSNATITDLDGKYTISVSPGQTLEVSYIGYVSKDVKVGDKTTIDIIMEADGRLLSDVVVVGYGQMKRSDLTGSVVSVDDKAIKQSVPTSIDQVLQGRAAGVQIQANSGTPGGNSSIRIRGTNSINSGTSPLYILDGVEISSSDPFFIVIS